MWIIPKNHPLSYHCVADMMETKLRLKECLEQSPQSLMWRSKPSQLRTWLARWKREKWFQLLSGRILNHSRQRSFETALISSLLATRVSRSQQQANDREQMTPGTCGLTLSNTCQSFDQDMFYSRMLRDISASGSPKSSPIWKSWATELRLDYSRRLKSARLINGSESSSLVNWPTASVSMVKGSSRGSVTRRDGKSRMDRLDYAVEQGGQQEKDKNNMSGNIPELYPTPSVCGNHNVKGMSKHSGDGLATAVNELHMAKGKLNPDWVEQLMGLPHGWTQLSENWRGCGDNRIDRLRLLGNGVVPATAEKAIRTLCER